MVSLGARRAWLVLAAMSAACAEPGAPELHRAPTPLSVMSYNLANLGDSVTDGEGSDHYAVVATVQFGDAQ